MDRETDAEGRVSRDRGDLEIEALAAVTDSFWVQAEVWGETGSCVMLRFSGALKNRDSRVLGRLLRHVNRRSTETVILDLTHVTRIDSTPLAALLMFTKEREPMDYALACVMVLNGPAVLDKLKTLGLAPLFEIYDSMEEAEYNLGMIPGLAGRKLHDTSGLNLKIRVKMVTSSPRTAIVKLSGYIQEKEADHLSRMFRQLRRRGARHVVVDVSGVSYANSPALGVLVSAGRVWKEVYDEHCIALAGVNIALARTLRLLGVEKLFVTASTVGKARRMLKGDELAEIPRRRRPSRPMHRI